MPTRSVHTEQLANLGVHLPDWPEEPEGAGAPGEWIQQGQAYAEGLRLWRAQLRSAAVFEGTGGDRLTAAVQNLCRQSSWDQSVVRYLLSELNAEDTFGRLHAAAKLLAANGRTRAQRLGAALELAREGLLVCAVEAIKQLVEVQQASTAECLDLCSLLVANLPRAGGQATPDPESQGMHWMQNVAVHLQASKVLATAITTASGEQSRAELVHQLDTLTTLAASRAHGPESDERAAMAQVSARERRQQTQSHEKPLLRTIHHLACTGGTVISKCLAAMPDVALISQVNPFNRFGHKFEPTNPLLLLERSYRQLSTDEITDEFKRQIEHLYQICHQDDVDLLLRDHSHTDFCMGSAPSTLCPIADLLSKDYKLLSVVTVRHPLDSYLGLLAQGWENQFSPSNLEEYSRRYLAFLKRYSTYPALRYEDFCAQPEGFMERLCSMLEISYSECFIGRFGTISLSGDSGRKSLDTIKQRPRRALPEQVIVEIASSESYYELLGQLGY